MKSRMCITLVFLVLCSMSLAKDKGHLPLAPKILSAKTVYIDNQSGQASLGDRAFQQITKWGRWKVISDRQSADLILLLSAHQYNRGSVTSTTGRVDDNGNINTTGNTSTMSVGYTYITVVDPQTGDNLWSESKRWGNLYTGFHSATKGIIDELMKRIAEDQSKK